MQDIDRSDDAQGAESSAPGRPLAPQPEKSAPPLWRHRHAFSGGEREAEGEGDLYATTDRMAHASLGRLTGGVSPIAIMQAFSDWAWHLSISPGKQTQLVEEMGREMSRLWGFLPHSMNEGACKPCIEPRPHDDRFAGEEWQKWPYNVFSQSFLLTQQWWNKATTGVDGVDPHHEDIVKFMIRQILDGLAPTNSPLTNPNVARRTFETGGRNFVDGYMHFLEDARRMMTGEPPAGTEKFRPGETVAVTPGKVIYRNRLMELIQYSPTTDRVKSEPLLIIPAWIMKYYILDLSPHNSLVRWLVEQGYTVFMVSWKNPDADDRDLGMEDYRKLGIMEAFDVINAVVPDQRIHGVGYCLGGTLLSIAAAAMARDGDDRLASLTLFASETDFEEAGELELFIDESQVSFLQDLMWHQGYLDKWQMRGTFVFLRSNDLVWSAFVKSYLMGESLPMFDLMAWSTDSTRMTFRMHSEYLERLYLENALANGDYCVDDFAVVLNDVEVPIFAVGTSSDHIAPWRSVYKIHLLTNTDVTFTLTSGGHNAGVISEPGKSKHVYQIADKPADASYVTPETWHEKVPERQGSWWPEWHRWLLEHSSGETPPPPMGAPEAGHEPLEDAPGHYVLQQ
ncbi:PHA/PHB synthase family protein [Halomonas daqiaonensis]|uniref:Polyhydroxyalkanoate synthase n=1 Tax=Halomonas daqiaonensis TaxID=650850 RepID=A0A1H7FTR1_9GAMM|nr:alpha/beta fold hydrolase [Halomonas daqiaonensis]SEK26735.1 polyhydroxyalkanoate synthase [Halomonas daqiaonensis]